MNSPPETNPCFEALLQYLKQTHNFDYTGYKRPSLMRRVQHRMNMIPIESYSNYTNYLEENPEEFTHLFNTIEINLTTFFRNALAWDYIAANVIRKIIATAATTHILTTSTATAAITTIIMLKRNRSGRGRIIRDGLGRDVEPDSMA